MGAFSGLKDAKRGFSSNPLQEGKYVVRIDECAHFEHDQMGEAWKNTLTILAVDEGEHRVGEIVTTTFWLKPGKKIFQTNVKGFMAVVLDVPDDKITEEAAVAATKAESPMKGLVTIVTARKRTSKTTKDKDTGEAVQYLVYSWAPSLDTAEIKAAIGDDSYAKFFPNA